MKFRDRLLALADAYKDGRITQIDLLCEFDDIIEELDADNKALATWQKQAQARYVVEDRQRDFEDLTIGRGIGDDL